MLAMYLNRALKCPPGMVLEYIVLHIVKVDVRLVAAAVPNIAAGIIAP